MKNVLVFLIFFLFGLGIVFGFRYWNQSQNSFNYLKSALTTKFSLQNAPNESLRGTIATMSGTVAWLSRTAARPVQFKKSRAIQQGESISTGANGNATLAIKNDALITLSPNTQLNIIQLLPQNFVFDQDKGTIRYQNTAQIPVSIKSYDLLTIMIGGIVKISVDSDRKTVFVTTTKGTIKEGYEDSQNNSTVVTVTAGQTFLFDDTTKTGTLQ